MKNRKVPKETQSEMHRFTIAKWLCVAGSLFVSLSWLIYLLAPEVLILGCGENHSSAGTAGLSCEVRYQRLVEASTEIFDYSKSMLPLISAVAYYYFSSKNRKNDK